MKKTPNGPSSRSVGSKSRPAFGKSAPFGKDRKVPPRKAGAGADSRPKRFVRGDEAPSSTTRSERTESRSGPRAGSGAGSRTEGRAAGFPKRGESRKAEGNFDRRPKRFVRRDEKPERTERTERTERVGHTGRAEGFAKAPSRFDKKPAFGKASAPRSYDRSEAPRKKEGFDKKPQRYIEHRAEQRTPMTLTKKGFQPKRESLQRQGILLWGLHAVREAWLNPKRKCYRLWMTEAGRTAFEETLAQATERKLKRPDPIIAQKSEIDHFLPQASVHQGVAIEVEPLDEISLDDLLGRDDGPALVIVLDQVTDPHNVGAILRSAAAFGADAVIVTERNAPNTTGTMAKTACGAVEHVPLISVVNLARALDMLKEENFWCVGLAEEGVKDLSCSALSTGRIALVLGAEGAGLRRLTREHCDELARLPTQGAIGSLNVSNAAAISLYEVGRQRKG